MIFHFILAFIACIFFVLLPVSVFIHELGHAVPALLFTKQKVEVYVGSYGNPNGNLRLSLGKLQIFIKKNPFKWNHGLCIYKEGSGQLTINQRIIITVCGPVATFLLTTLACFLIFTFDGSGQLKLLFVVALVAAILAMVNNLVPNNKPWKQFNGELLYNDGYLLKKLFSLKRLPNQYEKAMQLFDAKKFEKAATLFDSLLGLKIQEEFFFRHAIAVYMAAKKYETALEIHELLATYYTPNSDDYCNLGVIQASIGQADESIKSLNQSLLLNPENYYTLNNLGYFLGEYNKFEEAIPYLDKVIAGNTENAFAYNNRGLAKIKTGEIESGLADISISQKIDPQNAYTFRNMGIYFLDKKDKAAALENLLKAKKMDRQTERVDDLIKLAKALN